MNRKARRAAEKFVAKQSAAYPSYLVSIPEDEWPVPHIPKVYAVLRSKTFLVQLFKESSCIRMSVNRTTLTKNGHWSADISWEELQSLKTQAGFGDLDAVEIYPPDHDVVNVANMRHLWIMPTRLPFAWRSE